MYCAISGQIPEEPVVSVKSGHVFEKRLIQKALLATGGKCPESNVDLSEADLIPLKTAGTVTRPIPASAASFPGLLGYLQNEWDAVMLETHKLKKELHAVKQELAHALYQYDAARRVIGNLVRERDEARRMLAERGSVELHESKQDGAVKQDVMENEFVNGDENSTVMREGSQEDGRDADNVRRRRDEEQGAKAAPPAIPSRFMAQIHETHMTLRSKRKVRKTPKTLATRDEIQKYRTSTTVKIYEEDGPPVKVGALLSVGALLMLGSNEGDVHLLNTDTRSVIGKAVKIHDKAVKFLTVSPVNEERALSAGAEGKVRMWDWSMLHENEEVATGKRRRLSRGRKASGDNYVFDIGDIGDEVVAMEFSPAGCLFLTAKKNGAWNFHDSENGIIVSTYSGNVPYTAGAFHPDGVLFGMGTSTGDVQVWDVTSMENVITIGKDLENKGEISDLAMSGNGYSLVSCVSSKDVVRIWDLRKQQVAYEFKMPDDSGPMVLSLDGFGAYIAAVGYRGIRIFDTKRGRPLNEFSSSNSVTTNVAWGPDAKWLAAGRADGALQFFEAAREAGTTES